MVNFLQRSYCDVVVIVAVLVHLYTKVCCSMIVRDVNYVVPKTRRCVINNDRNSSGICKPLTACPAVIGLMRAGVNPTTCSSEGPAVVCCPLNDRISTKKCKEFALVLTEPLKAKEALVYNGTSNQKKSTDKSIKCETFFVGFISGGRNARPREYPYQVAVGYGDQSKPDWRCGGTLIDPQHVLTAGHCAVTTYGPPKAILLGDRKLSSRKDSTRKVAEVAEIYLHPEYKYPLQYNDIAIIKLKSAVPMSRAILPACLPNPEDRLDRALSVEATGWGQTGAHEGQSDVLQSVFLGKMDIHECNTTFATETANKERLPKGILPSQFCAGDKQGSRDTCKGDSGGPVTVSRRGTDHCIHYIVGITSFGSNFCGYQQPGVYTNVLTYLDWIENVVWFNSPPTIGATKLYTKINPKNSLILSPSSVDTTSTTQPPKKTTLESNKMKVGNQHNNKTFSLEYLEKTQRYKGNLKQEPDANSTQPVTITPPTTTIKAPIPTNLTTSPSMLANVISTIMPAFSNKFDSNLFHIPNSITDLLDKISKR